MYGEFEKSNIRNTLEYLRIKEILLLGLFMSSISVAMECDESIIERDSSLERFNLGEDPEHYNKRMVSLENSCVLLTALRKLYPLNPQNGTQINYKLEWDVGFPNASANYFVSLKEYRITVNGGILALKDFSLGALASTVCHEIGHILGGTKDTRRSEKGGKALNLSEGLADYFASQHCLKKIIRLDSFLFESLPKIERIKQICNKDKACIKILNAGYDHYYSGSKGIANLNLESTFVAIKLSLGFNSHPEFDCRFDSFINGYFCPEKLDVPCGLLKHHKKFNVYRPPKCFYP